MTDQLTFAEFGTVFKRFQALHNDKKYMFATFNAWSGDNPNVGIYYKDECGHHACYTSSARYNSTNDLYNMMRKELGELE